MSRYAIALAAWLIAVPVWAQPRLNIPAEIAAQPGQWVVVSPDSDCKAVTYVGIDGISAFPSSELKDPRKLVVYAAVSGRYRFVAVGSLNDEHASAYFTIVVGNVPPTPVPPGPTPPVPPAPNDPTLAALQVAYAAETDADKAAFKAKIVGFYRSAAANIKTWPVKTWGEVYAEMKNSAMAAGTAGRLPKLQTAIAAELKANLPVDPAAPLTLENRASGSDLFLRLARLLEAVQ